MQAGQDITALGAQIASDQGTELVAGQDINLGTADNSLDSHTQVKRRTKGLFKSGTTALTLGYKKEVTQNDTATHTVTGTRVGSTQGDVVIQAGRHYTQTGSEVLAQGDVQIHAANVLIQEARQGQQVHQSSSTQATGLSLAVNSTALDSAKTVAQMHSASRTLDGDARMQSLAGMSAALNVNNLARTLSNGTGDVSITLTLGSSRSSSEALQNLDSGSASQVAGKSVHITATASASGQDATSAPPHNLTVRGSTIQAAEVASLKADGELKLGSGEDHETEHSSSRNASAGVGLGVTKGQSSGAGITVLGGLGRGDSQGQATTHRNTHVTAGQKVSLSSGGDTVMQGAVVSATQIAADINGKLILQSPQDTASYNSKQWQVSGSASFGSGVGVSVQASRKRLSHDFQSVGEQTALRAGDGGFQITARGGTQLSAAQITSTQAAIDANRNVLTTPSVNLLDLQNHSQTKGNALGFSHSAGTKETTNDKGQTVKSSAATYSGGLGRIDEQGQSLSKAGVSGIAGHQDARTGDAATSLVSTFDPEAAKKQLSSQVAVTQAFSAAAPKAVAEFAAWQQLQATQMLQGLPQEQDPDARGQMIQEAQDQLDAWREGGRYRVAAHTVAGMLGAGWQGALGAGSSAALADPLAALQANVRSSLTHTGFNSDTAHMLSQLGVQAGASVLGGSLSGWSGAQWATAVDVNNRQLHDDEKQRLRKRAAQLAQDAPEPQRANATARWYRMLHETAYAAVDEQANAQWSSHLTDVAQARQPGLEGAYKAQAYLDNAAQAQRIIEGLAAEQQIISTPSGLITAFQATPTEYANHALLSAPNTTGQDSLLAEGRQKTLARFNVRTGTVQPDYPVEEFVASGLVAKVVSQVVGGALRGGVAGAVDARVGANSVGNLGNAAPTMETVGGAANTTAYQSYTDGLRAAMSKPTVSDSALEKLIDPLYRPNANVGSGSTAAAVREELATGKPVGGSFHSQKAQDGIRSLERWLTNNPTAQPGDRAAAENIIRDMRNAMGGKL